MFKHRGGIFRGAMEPGMGDITEDLQRLLGSVTGGGTATKTPSGGAAAVPTGAYGRFANITGVQTALQGAGFNPGAIDGVWGPNTAAAMRQFVERNGRSTAESFFGAELVSRAMSAAAPAVTGGGAAAIEQLTIPGGVLAPTTAGGISALLPASWRGVVEHPAFLPMAAGGGLIAAALAWKKWGGKKKRRGK